MSEEPESIEVVSPHAYLSREEGGSPDLCLEFMLPEARAMIWIGREYTGENAGKQIIAWHMVGKDMPVYEVSCVVAEGFPLARFIEFIRKPAAAIRSGAEPDAE